MVTSDDELVDTTAHAPFCSASRHAKGVSFALRNCRRVANYVSRLGITTASASGAEGAVRVRDSGLLALMILSVTITADHQDQADDTDLGPNAVEHVPSEEAASEFLGRLESLLRSAPSELEPPATLGDYQVQVAALQVESDDPLTLPSDGWEVVDAYDGVPRAQPRRQAPRQPARRAGGRAGSRRAATAEARAADEEEEADGGEELAGQPIAGPEELRFLTLVRLTDYVGLRHDGGVSNVALAFAKFLNLR